MSAETTFRRSNSIKKILSSPRDWTEWYGMTKSHAVHLQIWQYLDPEKEDGEIEQLVEPTRPVIPEIDLTSATCSQLVTRASTHTPWSFLAWSSKFLSFICHVVLASKE